MSCLVRAEFRCLLLGCCLSADGSVSANCVPQQAGKQATKHALSQGASVFENCISVLALSSDR